MIKDIQSIAAILFNELPREERIEISLHTMHEQVMQLEREKKRLGRSYARSVAEVNEHIKSIESAMSKHLRRIGH